jgi:hypothetical protein
MTATLSRRPYKARRDVRVRDVHGQIEHERASLLAVRIEG